MVNNNESSLEMNLSSSTNFKDDCNVKSPAYLNLLTFRYLDNSVINSLTLTSLEHICKIGFDKIKKGETIDESRLGDVKNVFTLLSVIGNYSLAAFIAKDYGLNLDAERFAVRAKEYLEVMYDVDNIVKLENHFKDIVKENYSN